MLDLDGVCGLPLTVGTNGWHAEAPDRLEPEEIEAVRKAAQSIEEFTSGILTNVVRPKLPTEALLVS